MTQVEVTNDGKKKRHSFRAAINIVDINPKGSYSTDVFGYGADEIEAKANFKHNLDQLIIALQVVEDKIHNE